MRKTSGRRILIAGVVAGCVAGVSLAGDSYVHAEKSGEDKRARENSAIEKTKEKGFDGVDFSYDLFGAAPGQSTAKIAEEAMAKDMADKSKVMAKQATLLKDRYRLDCKTHSGVLMTKGKAQPIGPTAQLKEGVSWEKLSQMQSG